MLFYILASCLVAFIIVFFATPSIIKVAEMKHLMDEPGERKAHTSNIPTLGGLGIFAGVIFSYTFFSASMYDPNRQYVIASLIILFFIGLKDDIIALSPSKKFIGQVLSASIIVFFAKVKITNMYGILGIHTLPDGINDALTLFTILVIVNSVNLIDGIDGLAGGIGAIASFTFAVLFYYYDEWVPAILSISLFGALLGFLYYNFSPARIFMGDTGSLIVGLILSILTIEFIEVNKSSTIHLFTFKTSPCIGIAILIIPLIDTFRVFFVRLIKRRSPFSADRNHIHHCLLDLGMNHRQVSMTMYAFNLVFIFIAFFFRDMDPSNLFFGIILLALLLSQIPFIIKFMRKNKPTDLTMNHQS